MPEMMNLFRGAEVNAEHSCLPKGCTRQNGNGSLFLHEAHVKQS